MISKKHIAVSMYVCITGFLHHQV